MSTGETPEKPRRLGGVKIVSRLVLLAAVAALVTWGAAAGFDFAFRMAGPAPAGDAPETVVMLDKGMSLSAISARLEAAGVVPDARLFKLGVYRHRAARDLKAGEYAIPARASMFEIMSLLREGKALHHRLTIPEGLTTAQALRLVMADPVLVGAVTLRPAEGSLLPDTYLFTRGETRDSLVRRMMKAQSDLLARLWPGRAADLPFKTQADAVTLASIVEKETGIAAERPRVAAVFVNRLRRGMRLQSDPTIIYGLTGGEPLGRGIRLSELQRETPYNTYFVDGLPPTPIANPGRDALAAVLNPPKTDELYFVADGTGGHAFSGSMAEHNRNVERWRAVERQQKGTGG